LPSTSRAAALLDGFAGGVAEGHRHGLAGPDAAGVVETAERADRGMGVGARDAGIDQLRHQRIAAFDVEGPTVDWIGRRIALVRPIRVQCRVVVGRRFNGAGRGRHLWIGDMQCRRDQRVAERERAEREGAARRLIIRLNGGILKEEFG
jgi:hypothetical protein